LGSAGDGYVPVHGGRVAERGEHAGSQVGAGDGESVRQVAVDRGAVVIPVAPVAPRMVSFIVFAVPSGTLIP
jgi:hypothetical protein